MEDSWYIRKNELNAVTSHNFLSDGYYFGREFKFKLLKIYIYCYMFRIFYLCVENGDCAHLVRKSPISHIIFFLKCIRRKQTNTNSKNSWYLLTSASWKWCLLHGCSFEIIFAECSCL